MDGSLARTSIAWSKEAKQKVAMSTTLKNVVYWNSRGWASRTIIL